MAQAGYDPSPPGRVRFEAIGEAWRILISDIWTWVVGSLVLLGGSALLIIPVYCWMVVNMIGAAAPALQAKPGPIPFPTQLFAQFIGVYVVGGVVLTVAGGLWMAAMQRLALRKLRGQSATASEFFSLDGHWLRIAGFNLLLPVLVIPIVFVTMGIFFLAAGLTYRVSPALTFFWVVVGYIVVFVESLSLQSLVQFAPLLIIDRKMPITDALALSAKTLWPQLLPMVGVFFCASVLSVLGEIACGIGLLVTMPIVYITIAVVYNDFFRVPQPAPKAEVR
jgi:hypothetical protein